MKKYIFYTILMYIIAFAINGCSTQKHSQSTEAYRAQSNVTKSDSLQHSFKDTASKSAELHNTVTAKDSSTTVTKKLKDSSSVSVTFNGGATDKPIVIQDSAGKTVIDAGGRNVTGVRVDRSQSKQHQKKDKGAVTNSVTDVKKDSTGVEVKSGSKTTAVAINKTISDEKQVISDSKSSVSFLARFGLYFIILIVAVLAWLVWKYWSKIKSWFI